MGFELGINDIQGLPVCPHLHSAFYTLSAAIGAEKLGETVFRQTQSYLYIYYYLPIYFTPKQLLSTP